MVDAGLVASELSLTNKCVEGRETGDLGELLGDDYKGYTWTADTVEERSNKLFRVDIAINRDEAGHPVISQMSVLFYRPESLRGQHGRRNRNQPMKMISDKGCDDRRVACDENPASAEDLHSSPVTRHTAAFTLLEVMIAITIFSIVLGTIYSTWLLIMRASKVTQTVAAQVQRQRVAIRTIEEGLTSIQSFQASMKYYTFIVDNGQTPMLSFTARVSGDFPRNGKFGDFDVRRLTFSLESGRFCGKQSGAAPEADSHGHGRRRAKFPARARSQRPALLRRMLGHERR